MPRPRLLLPLALLGVAALAPAFAGAARLSSAELLARVNADSLRAARMQAAGHGDSALVVLASLVDAARGARDPRGLARALRLRGAVLAGRGSADAALPLLGEALKLAEQLRDTSVMLRALRWQAYALGEQGRFDDQRRVGEHLLACAEAAHDLPHAASAQHTLSWIALRQGRFAEARTRVLATIKAYRDLHDAGQEASALLTYGSLLISTGDLDEARATDRRGLELAQANGLKILVAQAWNDLGVVENSSGDPALAAQAYRAAFEAHRALGIWQEATIDLGNWLGSLNDLGRSDEVLARGREALAICDAHGLRGARGPLLARMADAERALGRRHECVRLQRLELVLGDTLEVNDRTATAMTMASELAALDSLPAALALAQLELRTVMPRVSPDVRVQALAVTSGLDLRAGDAAGALALANEAALTADATSGLEAKVTAQANLARISMRLGQPALAQAAAARAIAAWEQQRGATHAPEWREALGGSMLDGLGTSAALASLAWPPTAPAATRAAAAFDIVQRLRARTLAERMAGPGAFSAADSARLLAAPVTLARVQAHVLRAGELLLDMQTSRDTTLVFAVTRDGVRVLGLPPAPEIAASLSLVTAMLARTGGSPADAQQAERSLRELAERWFAPLAPQLAAAHAVFVAPDGPLHAAPFEAMLPALASARGGTPPTVSRIPSAQVLERLRATAPEDRGHGVLAFAGPPYAGVALIGAAREVHELAADYADASIVAGAGDTLAWGPLLAAPHAVLHLAAHTRMDDESPWRTGLVVGETGGEPRLLTAESIAQMHLATSLVVLTSCRSASGRVLASEGLAGLTTAFLVAGAPAVVAALWPVDDDASARFTALLYDGLARGQTAAAALAAARATLKADPATAAPVHWAGWVLVGDGDVRPALAAKAFSLRHLRTYLVVVLALLTAIAASLGARQVRPSPRGL